MPNLEIEGTVLEIDEEGVDVEWNGHDFRLRKSVIERATGKSYQDVTDHDIMNMIEDSSKPTSPPRRIGDFL